jgi:hypothetical protein
VIIYRLLNNDTMIRRGGSFAIVNNSEYTLWIILFRCNMKYTQCEMTAPRLFSLNIYWTMQFFSCSLRIWYWFCIWTNWWWKNCRTISRLNRSDSWRYEEKWMIYWAGGRRLLLMAIRFSDFSSKTKSEQLVCNSIKYFNIGNIFLHAYSLESRMDRQKWFKFRETASIRNSNRKLMR